MFKINLCKTKSAYSVKPLGKVRLDLGRIKKRFKVVIDTPILLVIDKEGEIIVHAHGELIFKELKHEDTIKKIAQEIYDCIL